MNSRQSSINLFIALVGMMMTATAAYITPQPPLLNVPVSIVLKEQRQQLQNVIPSNSQQQHAKQHQKRPVSYSLGLGKNFAVGYSSTNGKNDSTDIIEAVQHWNEHETVNEFPNPAVIALARASMLESSTAHTLAAQEAHAAKRTKKASSPIIPQRFFHDQFPITTEQPHHRQHQRHHGDVVVDKSSTVPTMKSREPVVRQFDLNTPWVEMLIHEQQVKFCTAS